MKKRIYRQIFFFLLVYSTAWSQQDYSLKLRSGAFIPEKNISEKTVKGFRSKATETSGPSFVLIQFERIPTSDERQTLKNNGITLLEYVPNLAYTAMISEQATLSVLAKLQARALIELSAEQKMEPELAQGIVPPHASKVSGTADVYISYPEPFTDTEVTQAIRAEGYAIQPDHFSGYRLLTVRVPIAKLKELAAKPYVQYMQPIPPGDASLNEKSMVNSRANTIKSSGNLTGAGVVVGVGDESNPMLHVDLSSRVINRNRAVAGTHGMHVMGTVAGAGILNEKHAGYAPKATLISQFFSQIIAYTPQYVQDFGMVITNNSYGPDVNNCSNYGQYTFYSSLVDQQHFYMPNLQHVFAAGNDGAVTNCSPYPTGFGGILGGFQAGKNVITVANTDDKGLINSTSSRGPVIDGRLKPEIAAVGTNVFSTFPVNSYNYSSGTSMAAPAVAGGLALLYEKYKSSHSGNNPKSGLMKALLCNGATDLGNPGPDYTYGFGWMNLQRSAKMMDANAYYSETVSHGQNRQYTVSIPDNTAQVKVMLYWHDPSGAAMSTKNLVNNLDLTLTTPGGQVSLPLVLNPTPARVNDAAKPGVDNINNIEQVVLTDPGMGTYTIQVSGKSVVQNGPQEFFVVYDIIPKETVLTYPIGNEKFKRNDVAPISWDSYGNTTSTYTVKYSKDNGLNWQTIASNLSATTRQVSWTITDTFAEQAKVKVVQDQTGTESVSGEFVILGTPTATLSAAQCEGYISMQWAAVSGATEYEVYLSQNGEMVSKGKTTDVSWVFKGVSKDSTYWVAVRSLVNGKAGSRSVAVSRKPDTGTCSGVYSNNDLALQAIVTPLQSGRKFTSTELSTQQAITIRIKNLDDTPSTDPLTVSYAVNGNTLSTETINPTIAGNGSVEYTFPVTANFSAIGSYQVKASVTKASDPTLSNNSLEKTFRQLSNTAISLPFTDSFEALPKLEYLNQQIGFENGDRYDFTSSHPEGRIRSFVNSGMSYVGTRAFTLDSYQANATGITNYLTATTNLSSYDASMHDVRLAFVFKNHGQTANAAQKVWIRASDTDPWIEAYDLFANQNANDYGYKIVPSIEVSRLVYEAGKAFSPSFQVRWGQYGKTLTADPVSMEGYTFDEFKLFTVTNDIQVASIQSPAVDQCSYSDTEVVRVVVRNSSASTLTNIPIRIKIDSGPEITEYIPSIAARTNLVYEFDLRANLLTPGSHTIRITSAYATDSYAGNNQITVSYYHAPLVTSFPHYQNFENNNGYWRSDGKNSSWGYGTPVSPKINRAASGSRAWKTGPATGYNDSEMSYLYSPCFAIGSLAKPTLSFSLALDLEQCPNEACDNAYVEYSANGGAWTRLGAKDQGVNWYNKSFESSDTWSVNNYTRWHVATIPLPTGVSEIKFRFVLSADVAQRYEGIAIDDIHVYDLVNEIYDGATMAQAETKTVSNGNDWVHFTSANKVIASLLPGTQNLGATQIQAFIHSGNVRIAENQFYHDRNLTIKPGNTDLTDSVKIRFYFLDSETENLISAIGCPSCEKPSSAYELGISQYSHPFLEDGNLTNNLSVGWAFRPAGQVTKVPYDKGYYAEFNVKQFSEFWLSKSLLENPVPLPVTVSSFTVKKRSLPESADAVFVEWSTTQEKNAHHFEIEVARETSNRKPGAFTTIGTIPAVGISKSVQQYAFMDTEPDKKGIRYYRLKAVDTDHSFEYSQIRSLVFDASASWNLYPNPSAGEFTVTYQAAEGSEVVITIYDPEGKRVVKTTSAATGAEQKHKVNLMQSDYASGVYLIEISDGTHKKVLKGLKL